MNRVAAKLWKHAVFTAVFAGIAAGGGWAANSAQASHAKQKLAAVRARIAEIARRRGALLQKRDALGARLRRADLYITAKRRALDKLNLTVAAATRHLALLDVQQRHDLEALDSERSALAGQIVAAYMIGRREEVKMLLNQTDPANFGRMLTYYGYFGRARAAQLNAIRDRMQRLAALELEAQQESVGLKDLQDDGRRDLAGLVAARGERAAALLAAAQRVRSSDQQLAALRREEQSVESLIADLQRVMRDFPTDSERSFAQLRGKLPWPITGRLLARFHQVRMDAAQGDLRWNGVLIESARGARVRVPYFGRVVYADWLQGLGLLMIIAHSGGYLSLYGHAEVLYKSVGDWVAPGDVIAAMSDAPGPLPRLYFEIRQGRKPLNPQSWFVGSP